MTIDALEAESAVCGSTNPRISKYTAKYQKYQKK